MESNTRENTGDNIQCYQMTKKDKTKLTTSSDGDIQAFLSKVKSTPMVRTGQDRGRLIFAMDATASREASWEQASRIQAEMFSETTSLGGLEIQLCYYRGLYEFHASPWHKNADQLLQAMNQVSCQGGQTKIEQLLKHAVAEARQYKVNALVFIGDCLEEPVDKLCQMAGELGLLGVPMFIFHEGGEVTAANAFKELARITRGAYCPFDAGSAKQLRDLLSAVAVYAAGGRQALEDFHNRKGGVILRLNHQ